MLDSFKDEKTDTFRQLNKLLKSKSIVSDFAPFSSYSPVYIETNECQRGVLSKLDVAGKDVLCVTSSADFAFNALASGARKVTTFDKNKFAKYVLALKIATIKTYYSASGYSRFWLKDSPDYLSKRLFNDIKNYLSPRDYEFWTYVFQDNFNLRESNFIRKTMYGTYNMQNKYNIYYNNYYYLLLRQALLKEPIITYDLDITDIFNIKESFDVIYLSNILQYYKEIELLKDADTVHKFLNNLKRLMVKPGGVVSVNYCYWANLLEFCDFLDTTLEDLVNILTLKYPSEYDLQTFSTVFDDTLEGICLTRKRALK